MSAPLPWDVVTAKVEDALAKKLKALETVTPADLTRLQGEAAILRWVLDLPDMLENEHALKLDAATPGY